jgi:hypothetical protein
MRIEFAARPEVVIGGLRTDPNEELSGPPSLLRVLQHASGDLIVADGVAVKRFNRRGELVHTVGRRGRGPSEFQQIRHMCRIRGDSIIVLDQSLRRLTLLTSDLKFVGSRSLNRSLEFDGCFRDGSIIVRGVPSVDPASSRDRASAETFDMQTEFLRVDRDGGMISHFGDLPFETFTLFRSYVSAVVRNELLYFSSSDEPEVLIFLSNGTLVRRITWLPVNRPITPELIRGRVGPTTGSTVNGDRVLGASRDDLRGQKYVPEFGNMMVDHLSRIWLQDYPLSGASSAYAIVEARGSVIGRMEVPDVVGYSGLQLVAVFESELVFRARDSEGALCLLTLKYRVPPAK